MTHLTVTKETVWRATGSYGVTLASKASLLEEAKILLTTYAQLGDMAEASKSLIDTVLPQRSRATRATIVGILRMRLVRWNPPAWVLNDLVSFAWNANPDVWRVALLLHTARQDRVLYDFVQKGIVPLWYSAIYQVMRSDVQGFLDTAQEDHPEILKWSFATREKLSRNALTVLRDGNLLKGKVNKHIVAPHVPMQVAHHLVRLLLAEGIAEEDIAHHLDWRLWLWDEAQAQKAVAMMTAQGHDAWRTV
ncbi:MAG: hypothetical protein NVSMB49_23450 [Ktedonobacteraceae bacterium]